MIRNLIDEQLQNWDLAKENYQALSNVRTKELNVDGHLYKIQFNPARIVSSAAKVDKQSIQERKCFLCSQNRPEQQKGLPFLDRYQILVNPFPIFPKHLTVPDNQHVDQLILDRFGDMLDLANEAHDFIIFYNGPKCGASAPDHIHFQAGNKGFLTIENDILLHQGDVIVEDNISVLRQLEDKHRPALIIESTDKKRAIELFHIVYHAMEIKEGEQEPMMNLLAWKDKNKWVAVIFPREQHRPACYRATDEDNILISPASVDMGGVFITPLEKDFHKITEKDIFKILDEVCLSPKKSEALIERIKNR